MAGASKAAAPKKPAAGKAAAPKKPAGKAAAKAKAKAEPAAGAKLKRGKSTEALEVETVSSAAEKMQLQQRVLNLMKYRANHSKDAEKKSQAQQFLDMYWSKTATEKEGLLKEFEAAGGKNNTQWLMSVENQHTDATESRDKLREGFFTRTLLKLNSHSGPHPQDRKEHFLFAALPGTRFWR